MKKEYKNLKMKDCVRIIENNNRCVLSLSDGKQPFSVLKCYESDEYCGCIKLYLEVCKCGKEMKFLDNNANVCVLICCESYDCVESVVVCGCARILPPELDCCCKKLDDCMVRIEIIPEKIFGKCSCCKCC